MKTFSQLIESLNEAWPGTPEWNAKYGKKPSTDRHDVVRGDGVTKATRKYDAKSGESEEPEAHKAAGEQPVKRGRGRPPGKYGSYKGHNRTGKYVGVHAARKQKTQEAFDYLMTLESEEEIQEFMATLEEDVFADLHEYLVELEESEEILAEEEIEEASYQGKGNHRPGWMLRADPELAKKFKEKEEKAKARQKAYGDPSAGKSVKEDIEQIEEMKQGKEYTKDHIEKKIRTGDWEAVTDIKPGKHVELRHHTGKRIQVQVKEEIEQIEELSKDTLASYYAKSIGDRHSKDLARDSAKRQGDEEKANKLGHKVYNRSVGLEKAKTKFFAKEEVEQIEELSKSTLGSYIKKASHDVAAKGAATRQFSINSDEAKKKDDHLAARTWKDAAEKTFAKSWKRREGIAKAVDKLTKEEVEQTEENIKHPNQKALDKNGNGKLDKEDFKILRGEKKVEESETLDEAVQKFASFIAKK